MAENPDVDVEWIDCEQRSPEWHELHLGTPTASVFSAVMANGRDGGASASRTKLLHLLAGEILSGQLRETFSNSAMERGRTMEQKAIAYYEFTRDVEVEKVGFVRRKFPRNRIVGCSPDGKLPGRKLLEVKTLAPHLMVELMERGTPPTEHRAQIMGSLWVTGYDVCDLMFYYDGMPVSPVFTFERNDAYINDLAEKVEVFQYDLTKLVERIRSRVG